MRKDHLGPCNANILQYYVAKISITNMSNFVHLQFLKIIINIYIGSLMDSRKQIANLAMAH